MIDTILTMKDWGGTWRRRKRKLFSLSGRRISKEELFKRIAMFSIFGVIGGFFLMLIMFAWYARALPNPNEIIRREGFSTKILDRDGNQLYDLYEEVNRVPVSLANVPIYMQQATIAIEDKDFYKHEGFSVTGMMRGFSRLFTRGRAQGGSTLTQQLVKNSLLTSERSVARKFKELVLSIQIERKFSKDEILQLYLNEAPYGGTAWGIAAASDKYFGKKVEELSMIEAAILAGLPQAPTSYSPYGTKPDAYKGRTLDVLRRMREDGYITKLKEEELIAELDAVEFKPQGQDIKAPHFVFYVREQLVELLGEGVIDQGGYVVTTTLDGELQESAQQIVADEIEKVEELKITNGAAMVIDPNSGEILAMVGSKDYFAEDYDGQVNVVMSLRQPGSAIKPVTYATAFANGYSPSTMLMDVSTKFPDGSGGFYEPKNYDGTFRGPVQLRFALGSSLNVPAVKLLALVGVDEMLRTAFDMGFDSLAPTKENLQRFGLSVTLGGGEVRLFDLVRSYSVFANGGERVEPVSIVRVEKDGKTIYEPKSARNKRVLDEEVAFLVNHVLYDNNARLLTFGANSYLNMGGRSIAVKTGTTNDQRDNWTVGWSTNAVVGVWVGNNDNSPMTSVASGVSGASPIWRQIMLKAWEMYGGDDFSPPSGVQSVLVDTISGYPEHDGYPSRSEYMITSAIPSEPDPIHTKLKVCKSDTTKLATPVDIAKGEYEEKEYYVLKGYDPYGGLWEEGIDAWLSTVGDEKYHPPEEYCGSSQDIIVGIEEPGDKSKVNSNSVKIRMRATTAPALKYMRLEIDDKLVESYTSKYVETTVNLANGPHKITVVAENQDGKTASTTVRIGVNTDWDYVEPTPTPTPLPSTSSSPSPSPS